MNRKDIDWHGVLFVVLWMLVFALILMSMGGCSMGKEYRSSMSDFRDTVYVVKSEVRVDSVWRDRIQVVEVRGDSVLIRDSVVVERWRFRDVGDTLWKLQYIYLSDTVEVESARVVKERSGYDRFCSWAFWIMVVLVVGYLGYRIIRRWVR